MKRSAPETIVMLNSFQHLICFDRFQNKLGMTMVQKSALHVKTHSDEVKVTEKNIKTKRIDIAKKRTHNK